MIEPRRIIMCLVPIVATVAAAFLCYEGVAGWGWFCFLAFVSVGGGVSFGSEE